MTTATATRPPMPDAEIVCEVEPRQEWLKARTTGIGSSDAPLLALGRLYGRSRHDLFLEKAGLETRGELDVPRLRWGHLLEPAMREELARETGRQVHAAGILLRRTDWPFQIDSPDGFVRTQDGRWGVLELKTSSLVAWDEGVPEHVEIQAQHHMAVTGLTFCMVGVLRLGYGGIEGMFWIVVPRDVARIAALTVVEGAFWDAVERLEPPEVDGSEACKRALSRLYHDADPDCVVALPASLMEADHELRSLRAQVKDRTERITYLENLVKSHIGPAGAGVLPDGTVFTWKTQTRASYTVPESTYRVLRRKAGKLALAGKEG